METGQVETKTLFLIVAAVIFIEAIARILIPMGRAYLIIIIGATRVIEIITITSIALAWGKGILSLGLTRSRIASGFKKGLVWSAVFGGITFLGSAIMLIAGTNPLKLIQVGLPKNHREIILFFIIAGVVGPIAEELFFRGTIYGFLRRWGMLFALVLSTFVFVLAHGVRGITIPHLIGGIVFAAAYEVGQSITAPITIHIIGNLAIFTLSLIS